MLPYIEEEEEEEEEEEKINHNHNSHCLLELNAVNYLLKIMKNNVFDQ